MAEPQAARPTRVAVDVMGADKGPEEIVAGVARALKRRPDIRGITLVGDARLIKVLLKKYRLSKREGIEIVHTTQVIGMDEKPIQSLKQKKDSSMVRAIELVKQGEADAVLSCGNTGSLMAGGTIKLRPSKGVERPALAVMTPGKADYFVMTDAGANPEPDPIHLVHNAILASNYCSIELGIERPRVGLLTIGTEEGKGTTLTHETHELLKKIDGVINYAGLIEGFNIFESKVDVVVTDGFTGNVLLKTCESMLKTVGSLLKAELSKNWLRKMGAILAIRALRALKKRFNPDLHAGAPLLGLNGTIIKAHGSSNRFGICSALQTAYDLVEKNMREQIVEDIEKANRIIEASEEQAEGKEAATAAR